VSSRKHILKQSAQIWFGFKEFQNETVTSTNYILRSCGVADVSVENIASIISVGDSK
jgi:hypothetical protein